MSGCPQMTFEGLSAEKYASLLETAQAQGLKLSGDAGATSYQGMDFSWAYDAAVGTLKIHCTEKPFFVPCNMIEQKIRALLG